MKKKHSIKFKAVLIALLMAFSMGAFNPIATVQVHAGSVEELEARKAQIAIDLAAAQADLDALNVKSNELNSGLEALMGEQKLTEADYERLLNQVELAKNNMEVAVTRYTDAVKDVEKKQHEYEERITSMFRIRNKSTLEILLESDSMQGFLTNLRLMAYMSSIDQSMLTQLEDARETQKAAKIQAEQVKKDYDAFAAQKEKQIADVQAGIALAETEMSNVGNQILNASSDVEHLESEQVTTNAEIEAVMAVARAKAEAYAAEQAANEAAAAAEQAAAAKAQEEAAISASIANSEQAASVEAASIAESQAAAAREAESIAAAEEASRSLEAVIATATVGEDGSTDPATTTQPPETTAAVVLTTPATTLAQAPASGNSGNSGSSGTEPMIYPIPNYTRLSDNFGYRSDPATGATKMHWGIDFPAPAGTPIRAANSGEVIIASAPLQGSTYGWANNGFGNYVSILRNDGLVVMYAHLKSVYVSVGQYVSQGEVIGEVGSTGYSTGPHLHFQIRSPYSSDPGVSPWNYLN